MKKINNKKTAGLLAGLMAISGVSASADINFTGDDFSEIYTCPEAGWAYYYLEGEGERPAQVYYTYDQSTVYPVCIIKEIENTDSNEVNPFENTSAYLTDSEGNIYPAFISIKNEVQKDEFDYYCFSVEELPLKGNSKTTLRALVNIPMEVAKDSTLELHLTVNGFETVYNVSENAVVFDGYNEYTIEEAITKKLLK